MSVLLIRVRGAALLERSLIRRREGYADYVARTSGFFPRPPRRRRRPGVSVRAPGPAACGPVAGSRAYPSTILFPPEGLA